MSNLLRLVACLFVLLSFNAFAVEAGFPFIEQKVKASDGAYNDRFGRTVSIDSNTAVISAQGDDDSYGGSGSVYIFENVNGAWIQQQKLVASDSWNNAKFGKSVSISGDKVLIGSQSDASNLEIGAAYIFNRNDFFIIGNDAGGNGMWSEQQKLTPSDGVRHDQFGNAVSVSGDTVAVGAPYHNDNDYSYGAVYIYNLIDGAWIEQQKLTPDDHGSFSAFGYSISISDETMMIGAERYNNKGRVHVYQFIDGLWVQIQTIVGETNESFGTSVSVSNHRAVITTNFAAYVYKRVNGLWVVEQKLTPSLYAYGNTASISGDTVVIGSTTDEMGKGSAYIFTLMHNSWTEQLRLTTTDSSVEDNFGLGVSIYGNIAVVGSPKTHENGMYQGSAFFYNLFQDTSSIFSGDTSKSLSQGGSTTGTLLATDVDGLTDGSYFTISTPPVHGQAIINLTSGSWVYLGNPTYAGLDPFTVTVTDDLDGTTEQIISIMVTGTDTDGDTIYDPSDNCPNTANNNQSDIDNDQLGDACDPDIDGDGVDNTLDAFPNDATESSDSDSDNVGDNTDNCVNATNFDQSDIDSDTLGDACDADMDGDGVFNVLELRFGGDETDNTDASISETNLLTFYETAPTDSDLDGVPDDVEAMLGEDNTSSTFQDLLDTLSTIATAKNVPAMGSIGLLALGLSMLGLGAVRLRKE